MRYPVLTAPFAQSNPPEETEMTSPHSPRKLCFTSFALLATVFLSQPGSLAQVRRAVQADALDRARIAAAVGTERFSIQSLSLPDGLPERFSIEVELGGGRWKLDLGRHSVRSGSVRLRVYQADGTLVGAPLPPISTYRGSPEGLPGAAVLGSLSRHGLSARVQLAESLIFTIVPLAELLGEPVGPKHVVFQGELPTPELGPGCALAQGPKSAAATSPGAPATSSPLGPFNQRPPERYPCLKLCQIAFDGDYEFYLNQGGTVAGAVAKIDANLNLVDFFYARDVLITYAITEYVIRTAPFYFPTSGGSLLNLFQSEWINNQSHVIRDITHLMTGKPGGLIEYGGLAYVGVICDLTWGYGWSMDSAGIVGHELGHNWNAGHCHDLSPCNNMCGACLFVAPITQAIIMSFRDSRACLDDAPPYTTPLPPYARPDSLTISKANYSELLNGVEINVLKNDHDGNCDSLRINSFDAVTQNGATVSLSVGPTGGRQRLIYTPPLNPVLGEDHFSYTAEDGSGGFGVGSVTVKLIPGGMNGYWKLNDGTGAVATDSISPTGNAALHGPPIWGSGLYAGDLFFSSNGDSADIPPLQLNTNRITFSTWLFITQAQPAFAGLIFSRGGSTLAGLHFGDNQELRYTWNGDPQTYTWNSGLVVPQFRWVFVSLVVEPEGATLYLYDGSLQSATNAIAHAPEAFDAVTHLGKDPLASNRSFKGHLDDVRIHGRALSSEQVSQLARLGGGAYGPRPAEGATLISSSSGLNWFAGHLADSHDVYLGTDFAVVRDATSSSPEYQGNQISTTFLPGVLTPQTPHFWRVDEVVGGEVVKGDVWQFTPAVLRHFELDEVSGSAAIDSGNGDHGTFVNGPVLGQPGATPSLGTSVSFDGWNDRVDIPPLNINSNSVTITAWVWLNGTAQDYSGIVFSRDGSSVCGLQMGLNNELRYTWNNASNTYGWDSGLGLTIQRWAFCALVVEPHQATLYRGESGVLTSAVNPVAHGLEEFDGLTTIGESRSFSASVKAHIDDVRIYDGAMTPLEIAALFAASQ